MGDDQPGPVWRVVKLPDSFVQFLQQNQVDVSAYHDQLGVDVPRFIRLNPFAVLDLVQLGAELGCVLIPTALDDFFALPGHVKVSGSAAFSSGQYYGIDLASGIAVDNLDLASGQDVLDLCCAPGAKLAMICDRIGRHGSVLGVDVSDERLNVTRRQFVSKYGIGDVPHPSRLRLRLECGDGVKFDAGIQFDRVLVDAECTHDGSLKHIVKYSSWGWDSFEKRFLQPDRIERITTLQRSLLLNGFRHLKVGGVLVYSTCSFCLAQNEDVVQWLLDRHRDAHLVELNAASCAISTLGVRMPLARRLDPIMSRTSALFIAKLTKLPS